MTVDAAVDAQTSFETEAIPYMRLMFPAALRLTRDRGDAEDLIQETFARAYQKFHLFTPGTNLRAWLHRIMFHTFYSSCRKRRSRPPETLAGDLFETQDTQSPTVPPTRSAEAEALDNLAGSPVMRALRDLPACFKTVVYLADVEGYRYAEIAELMGTPLGTVMSRIHRGRQMLRSRLAEPGALATVSPVRPVVAPSGADTAADAEDASELDPALAA
jgi:RNA polymerase sigma-70 factor (ECF subfamily)